MLTSTSGVQSANAASDLSFTKISSAGSMDSFAQQLLSAIEGYLGKSGNNSQLEIDIQGSPQGQNSDTRQFTVTVRNHGTAETTASAKVSTAPTANVTPFTVSPPATVAPATVVPATRAAGSDTATAVDKSQMSPDDAYWAMQPPAVQALRYMPDDQRGAAAMDLAKQGYTIDVPIMVLGWDPLGTMVQRQIDGYTWVPSGLQDSIPAGPGIDFPGRPKYDANNPPPGSIKVSTDFAIGTNGKNPAMAYVNTATT